MRENHDVPSVGHVGMRRTLELVDRHFHWRELRGDDTLAWATGTGMGTGDHAIALFCIEYGCVLGLHFDTLHFEV